MIRLVEAGGGTPLNQLKITLRHSKPPIWRRVIVRADMTLDRLHRVIQTAMGWTDSHLHQFWLGRVCYGVPDRGFEDFGSETLNEKQYTVADLAPVAKRKPGGLGEETPYAAVREAPGGLAKKYTQIEWPLLSTRRSFGGRFGPANCMLPEQAG